VRDGLAASLQQALDAGILPQSIVLDPGYGFGKRFQENFDLLARQQELLAMGYPLLAGVSRKSFLTKALSESNAVGTSEAMQQARETAREAASESASVAAMVIAILKGASIVRVHAVRAAVAAAAIADAMLAREPV
jgi:dihydropteroate synthase